MLVVLEGGEGVGKTTQSGLLASWLREAGHEVVTTREPGGTPLGGRLRTLLLDPAVVPDPRTEALLYAADRAEHVAHVVRPALARGAVVVCDRFVDSSVAYQGGGRELSAADVRALSAFATAGLVPDLVVVLDDDPAAGLARAAGRGQGVDRLEGEDVAFHARVRETFRAAARADPSRYAVVDAGAGEPEVVAAAVRAAVARVVPPAAAPAAGPGQEVPE